MSDNNQAERQPADQHLQDKPQLFRTLRNIYLNLSTIFES
ncbi:LysR family transcriptional regulator, partial [Salmonella enterica subsp. enterica serovar Schwarzengrund]